MKKILVIGIMVLGLSACQGTGEREHTVPTVTEPGNSGTVTQDPTGTSVNDAYRDDTGESGLTTDTSTRDKSKDSLRRKQ